MTKAPHFDICVDPKSAGKKLTQEQAAKLRDLMRKAVMDLSTESATLEIKDTASGRGRIKIVAFGKRVKASQEKRPHAAPKARARIVEGRVAMAKQRRKTIKGMVQKAGNKSSED